MNKKRLITTSLIGVIGLISLSISFSLAWYASSTRLAVRTIKIEIDDDRDLKISTSTDRDSFKQTLQEGVDDLNKVELYKPVSSMLSKEWMDQYADMPQFRDSSSIENIDGQAISDVLDGGFYRQELYLLADDDVYVTIDPEKTKIEADKDANRESARDYVGRTWFQNYTEDQVYESLNNLVNCVRISVLVPDRDAYDYKIVDPYKSGETLLGGLLDNMNDQYYDTYENTVGQYYEIVYGEVYNRDKIVYDEPTNVDSVVTGEYSAFNARIKGSAHHFNYEASVANGFSIKQEESLTLDDLKGVNSKIKIPCKRGEPRKIVLSIYLEGWDRDNINNTMGAHFISDIAFKIAREM